MAASSRGGFALKNMWSSAPNTCARCAGTQGRYAFRSYSTAAAVESPAASPDAPQNAAPNAPAPYDIRSGLILTRPPLLTRRLQPLENAFFFYQKRLEERLNSPFITDIFYKPDTARRLDWDLKVKARSGTVAKELGVYHGKSARAWDDELRIGDELSSQEHIVESIAKDAVARVSDDAEVIAEKDLEPVEMPKARLSEADHKSDTKRLDRQMDKTLYLVVKSKDGWAFPADVIHNNENLHECAKRVIDQAAGVDMNLWLVGRVPVAHVVSEPVQNQDGSEKKGQKTFFIKGRIMAGQANLENNPYGYTDFKWLTREELEKELPPAYWKGVRNMMSDR